MTRILDQLFGCCTRLPLRVNLGHAGGQTGVPIRNENVRKTASGECCLLLFISEVCFRKRSTRMLHYCVGLLLLILVRVYLMDKSHLPSFSNVSFLYKLSL